MASLSTFYKNIFWMEAVAEEEEGIIII